MKERDTSNGILAICIVHTKIVLCSKVDEFIIQNSDVPYIMKQLYPNVFFCRLRRLVVLISIFIDN